MMSITGLSIAINEVLKTYLWQHQTAIEKGKSFIIKLYIYLLVVIR